MDEVQGDDGYSDDDLDALPAAAFHELQENAIRTTQQPLNHASIQPNHRPVIKPSTNLTSGVGGLSWGGLEPQQGHAAANPEPPSSDYGDFDDEMLDGEIYDAAEQPAIPVSRSNVLGRVAGDSTQREEWRQQRFDGPPHPREYKEQNVLHNPQGDIVMQDRVGGKHGGYRAHQPDEMLLSQGGEDVESLQAQVRDVRLYPDVQCMDILTYFTATSRTPSTSPCCGICQSQCYVQSRRDCNRPRKSSEIGKRVRGEVGRAAENAPGRGSTAED